MLNAEKTQQIDKNNVIEHVQFYRIDKVAEMLGCTTGDVLQLGISGKIAISAPIIAGGKYTWPNGLALAAFPEISEPFTYAFDEVDRVVLSMHDLARIEAVGGVIPQSFISTSRAQQAIDSCFDSFEEIVNFEQRPIPELQQMVTDERLKFEAFLDSDVQYNNDDKALIAKSLFEDPGPMQEGVRLAFHKFQRRSADDWYKLRKLGLESIWKSTGQIKRKSPKTTIDHLFVSREQVENLTNVVPKSPKKANTCDMENGHTERHHANREAVLFAFAYCLQKYGAGEPKTATEWARLIEQRCAEFWTTGQPRLSLATIETLLRLTKKPPSKKYIGK